LETFARAIQTRAICIEPTLFDELMLVMKFRVLQPCRGTRDTTP